MATYSNFFNVLPARRALVIAAATITLAACSGESQEILADPRPVAVSSESISASVSEPPASVEAALETSTSTAVVVESAAISAAPTTAAPTSPAPTTVVSTTAAPAPTTSAPTILAPSNLDGAFDDLRSDQRVLTSVGDPLNVRTGPGVSYEIVAELVHETDGITATSAFNLDESSTWRYIERDGEVLGWVHGDYLFGHGVTSTCVAGDDFPTFEGANAVGTGDVDVDGAEDEIFVLTEATEVGVSQSGAPVFNHEAWVLVSFANGGVATGKWTGFYDPHLANEVRVFDLTTLGDFTDFNEIIFAVGFGVSHGQHGVMTLVDCELVPTTVAGSAFSFSHGASAGLSTVGGCAYGPHGEIEFVVTSTNFNTGGWSITTYQLSGTEWADLGTISGMATDSSELPNPLTLEDCIST